MTPDRDALLEVSAAIHSTRDLETLEKKLLEIVSRTLYADRGAILLLGESGQQFASVCGWDSREELNRPAEYSRAIIDQVLRQKAPLLSNRDSAAPPGGDMITAALCVPLIVFERIRGVLYVDSTNPKAHFEPAQLAWLSAIGGIAVIVLEDLRRIQWLEGENSRLRAEIAVDHQMVGSGPALREVETFIARVAPTDSTVLIQGESGTGKELVARAIHRNSSRSDGAFIAINCAAITRHSLRERAFRSRKGRVYRRGAHRKGQN